MAKSEREKQRTKVTNAARRLQTLVDSSPSSNPIVRRDARMLERLSALVERASMAAWLGKTYGGERDMYSALGYKSELRWADLYARYERGDIAKAVIDAPIDEVWREPPTIYDQDKEEGTEYANAVAELVERIDLWTYFKRLHTQGAIGDYSVLVLGAPGETQKPLEQGSKPDLLFVMPYSEGSAQVSRLVTDTNDPRFGKPDVYRIAARDPRDVGRTINLTRSMGFEVHWTRTIHHAVDLLEDEVRGAGKLRAPWNRLDDLDKVIGGASEAYWRGARPGIGVMGRPGASFKKQTLEDMKEELLAYIHGFQSFLRLQNADIEQLNAQAVDPSKHSEVLMTLIAATVRIPKRILFGTERGELASDQDERAWRKQVAQERTQDIEPTIRRFFSHLSWLGTIPEPQFAKKQRRIVVDWPPLDTPGDKEQADVAKTKAEALATFFNSMAADQIPADQFYKLVLRLDPEEIKSLEDAAASMMRMANGREAGRRIAGRLGDDDLEDDDLEDDDEPVGVGRNGSRRN